MLPISKHKPRVEGCLGGFAPPNPLYEPNLKEKPRVEACRGQSPPPPFMSPIWKDHPRVEGEKDAGDNDDGRIFLEHPSSILHAPRDNTEQHIP